jgi:hypothetical protein
MSGGIETSKQFIGVSVRKPYSEEYGSVGLSWPDTESGIAEAHGHADLLAEKLNVPRHAVRVARYVTSTQMVEPEVPKPATKQPKSPTAKVPALDEAVLTKDGKSTTVKLGKK